MQLHGIPNDIMQNIDALTIIVFIPILDRLVYPFLRKIGIPFRPITRITFGFIFAALAMAYAAITQHLIYSSAPCFSFPLACPASPEDDPQPNKIHVAVQSPAYFFIAISEIFAVVTGLEYAFTKAPPSMKCFVMSIFLLQTALGNALGIALSPTAEDPKLVWMYSTFDIPPPPPPPFDLSFSSSPLLPLSTFPSPSPPHCLLCIIYTHNITSALTTYIRVCYIIF